MLELPSNQSASRRAINRAGIASFFASIELVTFSSYVVIFLEIDLLTAVLIISIIVSLRNALQIFFRIPLGELSQIIGRKMLILMGHFCFSVAVLILFIAYDWLLVLIATIFLAAGMSSFWPALFAYISDSTPQSYGASNGKIFALWDLGIIVASLVSKFMLDILFFDLKELFFIVGGFGMISGFIIIAILPESLLDQNRMHVASIPRALINSVISMFSSFVAMTKLKGMPEVYSFQFALAFLGFMVQTFFPVLIVYRGFTKGTVSEIFFWSTLVLLWFKPYLGKISDRFTFSSLIAVLLVICAALVGFMALVTELWLFIVVYIVFFGCIITAYTATNGETTRRSPDIYRGTAIGALGVYVSIGRTTSTLSLGPVWDFIGLEAVFYITAIVTIVFTIIPFVYFMLKNKKRHKYLRVNSKT